MPILAFGFYDVILFVHILAVVVAFGVVFTYPVLDALARRANVRDLASLHRFQAFLSQRVVTPAMVVVLAAGIYLAADRWEFSDFWISATFLILIVLFGLVGAVLAPTERRLAELAERDVSALGSGEEKMSTEYEAQARRLQIFGGLSTVLIVIAIFLMSTKIGS